MINEVTLIGHVGGNFKPAQVSQSGTVHMRFGLATSEDYKRGDEWIKNTVWHNIVVFGDLATRVAKHLAKGQLLLVKGKIVYNTQEYQGIKTTSTSINAKLVRKLKDGKEEEMMTTVGYGQDTTGFAPAVPVPPAQPVAQSAPPPPPPPVDDDPLDLDDDIPF